VAARTRSRPLYAVFLERVIQIEAVQRHRAAVTDDDMAQFFSEGRPHWTFGDFRWSLDAPKAFPWRDAPKALPWSWQGRAGAERSVSLPMQHAWNAAAAAFEDFIKALKNGELVASGVHPATGARYDLDPAEWTREWLILDVRNGELVQVEARDGWFDLAFGKKTVRWIAITLRAAKQPRQKKERGHGYDWKGAWAYALTLRADDQWDWKKYRRHKKQPLPAVRKIVEDRIKDWFRRTHRGRVPDISDIRRNITIPLYAGRRTRGKRKR
jgi:hypothetical protein